MKERRRRYLCASVLVTSKPDESQKRREDLTMFHFIRSPWFLILPATLVVILAWQASTVMFSQPPEPRTTSSSATPSHSAIVPNPPPSASVTFTADTPAASKAALDNVVLRIERLEAKLEHLTSEIERITTSSPKSDEFDSTPFEPEPLSPEEIRAELEERHERLETVLLAEPEDPVWKDTVATGLQEAVDTLELAGGSTEITCGNTFCRVEGWNRNTDSLELFSQAVLEMRGISGGSISMSNLPDGTWKSTLYLVHPDGPVNHPALN